MEISPLGMVYGVMPLRLIALPIILHFQRKKKMLCDNDFYIEYDGASGKYCAILVDGTEIVLLSKTQNDAEREASNLVYLRDSVYDEY
jgi:hypothetical protein